MTKMLERTKFIIFDLMNQLPLEKRTQIIQHLVEGNSIRITARFTDVSKNTVTKLLQDVGRACQAFQDEKVNNLRSKCVRCHEIWSFVYSQQKNVPNRMEDQAGNVWTWVGIDAESKLVISWYVGNRSADSAYILIHDVAGRLSNMVQFTTDGQSAYLEAVEDAFGGIVDYERLVKLYGIGIEGNRNEKKYNPVKCVGTKTNVISSHPETNHVSTSYLEGQNIKLRMHMRRSTCLTNAFSKKIENHAYAVALHFVYYNFCKKHNTIRITPAMEAGLMNKWMDIEDIVNLV